MSDMHALRSTAHLMIVSMRQALSCEVADSTAKLSSLCSGLVSLGKALCGHKESDMSVYTVWHCPNLSRHLAAVYR
jgi:hypothetical protein